VFMAKKIRWSGVVLVGGAAIAMALMAHVAGAATTTQTTVVNIGAAGKTTLRGTIDAISGQTLSVKSWGGDWTVRVGVGTQILPNLTGNDFVNFQVGDYVAAQGTVDQTGNWSVNATLVRDYTYRQTAADQQKANRTTASQTIKSETPRNYIGIASGIGDGSFTLLVNGEADIVNVNAGAHMGWVTGVLMFPMWTLATGVELFFDIRSGQFEERMKAFQPGIQQQMTDLMHNGPALFASALLMMAVFFLISIGLTMAGGALSAKMSNRP